MFYKPYGFKEMYRKTTTHTLLTVMKLVRKYKKYFRKHPTAI